MVALGLGVLGLLLSLTKAEAGLSLAMFTGVLATAAMIGLMIDIKKKVKIGIRIASEEEPNFEFYTSRLGIRYSEIKDYFVKSIKKNKQFQLKMLHFFINTGIKDNAYYWSELNKCVNVDCELKKLCPD